MQKYDYYMDPEKVDPAAEIVIHNVGFSACPPNYTYGWDTRKYYLIHFCVAGAGTYITENQEYPLHRNQGFLITPNSTIMHLSDPSNPWSLYWVGFSGEKIGAMLKQANLDESHLTFSYDKDDFIQNCIENIYNNIRKPTICHITLMGHLLLLIGKLSEMNQEDNDGIITLNHFEKAARYIKLNIRSQINISDLAHEHNVDTSQLYRSFIKHSGMSPKQYLEKAKMKKACDMITKTDLSFHEISEFLGYEYDTHFYKSFKKQIGMRPTEYKKTFKN